MKDMIDVKYIYFELHYIKQKGMERLEFKEPITIENINVLLLKPHTSSTGDWGSGSISQTYKYKNEICYKSVEQYWFDLDKWNPEIYDIKLISDENLSTYVTLALEEIKTKII